MIVNSNSQAFVDVYTNKLCTSRTIPILKIQKIPKRLIYPETGQVKK